MVVGELPYSIYLLQLVQAANVALSDQVCMIFDLVRHPEVATSMWSRRHVMGVGKGGGRKEDRGWRRGTGEGGCSSGASPTPALHVLAASADSRVKKPMNGL